MVFINLSNYLNSNYIEISQMSQNNEMSIKFIEYDAIFVGQLGAVACSMFLKSNNQPYKCLVINNTQVLKEPALLPIQSSTIEINKISPKQSDLEVQRISKIMPQACLVAMENKKIYRYKFLIFTTKIEDWSDFSMIENLEQALSTSYSFVYSNILKSDPKISSADIIFTRFEQAKKLEIKRQSAICTSKNKTKDEIIQNSETQRDIQKGTNSEHFINLVFYIPKPPHAGYDNFNLLIKFDEFVSSFNRKSASLRRKSDKLNKTQDKNIDQQSEDLQLNFIVLLEGTSIFPHCKQLDLYVRDKLQSKGIQILQNHKIQKIDYLRRKISVKCTQFTQNSRDQGKEPLNMKNSFSIGFDYLYVVLKQKTPTLLSQANINPFDNCERTLSNSSYPNVYVLGANVFPTSHSFVATNFQCQVVATNLLRMLKHPCKKVQDCNLQSYQGYTRIKLWINRHHCIEFEHLYEPESTCRNEKKGLMVEQIIKKHNIKQGECCFWFLNYTRHKYLFQLEVSSFYNLQSYGAPYYFFIDEHGPPQLI